MYRNSRNDSDINCLGMILAGIGIPIYLMMSGNFTMAIIVVLAIIIFFYSLRSSKNKNFEHKKERIKTSSTQDGKNKVKAYSNYKITARKLEGEVNQEIPNEISFRMTPFSSIDLKCTKPTYIGGFLHTNLTSLRFVKLNGPFEARNSLKQNNAITRLTIKNCVNESWVEFFKNTKLSNLVYLELYKVNLGKNQLLIDAENLIEVKIIDCNISKIPNLNSSKIEKIDLSKNNIRAVNLQILNFNNLNHLDFSHNKISKIKGKRYLSSTDLKIILSHNPIN